MSGGHFNYNQYLIREIAQKIEEDIARALKPKPEKVHENYWTIEEKDNLGSCRTFGGYMTFNSYVDAASYLLSFRGVRLAEPQYASGRFFKEEDVIFQSDKYFMRGTEEGEKIPVLYAIHHAEYDRYPYDEDVLELSASTIGKMKEAYRQIRIAEIHADRVDWLISDDDDEESFQDRLKHELDAFDKEFQSKDWTGTDDEEM